DARTEIGESIDPAKHVGGGHRRRAVVVLVAVRARQVATPDRNEMCRDRLIAEAKRPDQHSSFANTSIRSPQGPPQSNQAHDRKTTASSHTEMTRTAGLIAGLAFERVYDVKLVLPEPSLRVRK